MSSLFEMFSYGFVIRAFCVGIMVCICSSLLGVPLVLKKFSMIGDGLSHVGFGAMTIALALNVAPLYVAVPVMVISAFALLQLKRAKIDSDAAIAILSSASIAIGIIAASLSGGMNTDVYGYMFGSILAVSTSDVIVSAILCVIIIAVFVFFYNKIFATTFDAGFAEASGTNTRPFDILYALLTAVTIVIGMRIMGTMLISGLIILPAITSMRLCKRFKTTIIVSLAVSVISFTLGMIASYNLSYIPTGAGIVLANVLFLIVFSIIGRLK